MPQYCLWKSSSVFSICLSVFLSASLSLSLSLSLPVSLSVSLSRERVCVRACVRACVRVCVCVFPSGYKVSSCNTNGRFTVKETAAQNLTCTEITDDYMFWDFTPTGGTRIQIASCTWSNSKFNITDSDYAVIRPQNNTSILTVKRNHRTKIAGVVRCGGAFSGGTATLSAPCNVRVVCKYTSTAN